MPLLLRVSFAAALAAVTLAGTRTPLQAEPVPAMHEFEIATLGAGARISLIASDTTVAVRAAEAASAALTRIDGLMNNSSTTEVARFDPDPGRRWTEAHPEVAVVLEALEVEAAWTRGRFQDEGMRIDPGGMARGYGVDAAAGALAEAGITAALVDLSGNMAAMGSPPWRETWTIAIRDPRGRVPSLGSIQLTDRAVATSGRTERTGRPAGGFIAVTVVAPTATLADAWGTALLVLGPEQAHAVALQKDDIEAIFVEPTPRGDLLWIESSLRNVFQLDRNAIGLVEVRYF